MNRFETGIEGRGGLLCEETPAAADPAVGAEARRRRTFAIISHPDAGKTTLTEKLLLYGGAIQLAGTVKAARNAAGTPPPTGWSWSSERGISITSTVLQFDYRGPRMNLLDTPGHADFSEDTYRTLIAADCAVMLIDAAKGVEPQTMKLFQVCRLRQIPIFTFVNKMDRPGREPLELMDEVEQVLGIGAVPDELADRHRRGVPRRLRPPDAPGLPLRPRARTARASSPTTVASTSTIPTARSLGEAERATPPRGHRAARRRRRRVRPRAVPARAR